MLMEKSDMRMKAQCKPQKAQRGLDFVVDQKIPDFEAR